MFRLKTFDNINNKTKEIEHYNTGNFFSTDAFID